MSKYKIVRFYRNQGPGGIHNRVVLTGLTLEQAQAHCSNPETSSSTATGKWERDHTALFGAWFDGYTEEV